MLHGIRPGKARALKVKHVNIDRETILISSTFSGKEIRDK
jgi:integrase